MRVWAWRPPPQRSLFGAVRPLLGLCRALGLCCLAARPRGGGGDWELRTSGGARLYALLVFCALLLCLAAYFAWAFLETYASYSGKAVLANGVTKVLHYGTALATVALQATVHRRHVARVLRRVALADRVLLAGDRTRVYTRTHALLAAQVALYVAILSGYMAFDVHMTRAMEQYDALNWALYYGASHVPHAFNVALALAAADLLWLLAHRFARLNARLAALLRRWRAARAGRFQRALRDELRKCRRPRPPATRTRTPRFAARRRPAAPHAHDRCRCARLAPPPPPAGRGEAGGDTDASSGSSRASGGSGSDAGAGDGIRRPAAGGRGGWRSRASEGSGSDVGAAASGRRSRGRESEAAAVELGGRGSGGNDSDASAGGRSGRCSRGGEAAPGGRGGRSRRAGGARAWPGEERAWRKPAGGAGGAARPAPALAPEASVAEKRGGGAQSTKKEEKFFKKDPAKEAAAVGEVIFRTDEFPFADPQTAHAHSSNTEFLAAKRPDEEADIIHHVQENLFRTTIQIGRDENVVRCSISKREDCPGRQGAEAGAGAGSTSEEGARSRRKKAGAAGGGAAAHLTQDTFLKAQTEVEALSPLLDGERPPHARASGAHLRGEGACARSSEGDKPHVINPLKENYGHVQQELKEVGVKKKEFNTRERVTEDTIEQEERKNTNGKTKVKSSLVSDTNEDREKEINRNVKENNGCVNFQSSRSSKQKEKGGILEDSKTLAVKKSLGAETAAENETNEESNQKMETYDTKSTAFISVEKELEKSAEINRGGVNENKCFERKHKSNSEGREENIRLEVEVCQEVKGIDGKDSGGTREEEVKQEKGRDQKEENKEEWKEGEDEEEERKEDEWEEGEDEEEGRTEDEWEEAEEEWQGEKAASEEGEEGDESDCEACCGRCGGAGRVRALRACHFTLCEAGRLLNAALALPLLLLLGYVLTVTVACVFYSVHYGVRLYAFWLVLNAAQAAAALGACGACAAAAGRGALLASRCLLERPPPAPRAELARLRRQLALPGGPLRLSACGLFALDGGALLGMAGAAASSAAILLQFECPPAH